MGGLVVRINVPDERRDVLATCEGDEVIVAGNPSKPVFEGLAFRNISQRQFTHQVSTLSDILGAAFFVFLGFFGFLGESMPKETPNLYPLPTEFTYTVIIMSFLFGLLVLLRHKLDQ